MERPDTHTLIAAYALDGVDEDEREAFEQHLASCEGCREEVDGLRRTALRLADAAGVPPPQQLRDRVLADVRVTPQVRDAVLPAPRRHDDAPAARSRIWLAAAAVLAVVALGSGALAWTQYRAADAARAEAARMDAVVTDPGARLVQQRLAGGGRLVVAPGRRTDGVPHLRSDPDVRQHPVAQPLRGRGGGGVREPQDGPPQPVDVLTASFAGGEVLLEGLALVRVDGVQGVGGDQGVSVRPLHHTTPRQSRRRISPSRSRVFTVPRGTSSRCATSWWVCPA